MCVYVNAVVYTHVTHIYIYIHTHTHTCMHIHTHSHTHTHLITNNVSNRMIMIHFVVSQEMIIVKGKSTTDGYMLLI